MGALFAERSPISPDRARLAEAAWRAYCDPEPRRLQAMLSMDFAGWPRLRDGILAHLRRFPSTTNGLNLVERTALEAIGAQAASFPRVFRRVNAAPGVTELGMGDSQFAVLLKELASGVMPVLSIEHEEEPFAGWQLTLTPAGKEVLSGQRDWQSAHPLDRWLGGVHLSRENEWRWG
jgi:hypothetical protein